MKKNLSIIVALGALFNFSSCNDNNAPLGDIHLPGENRITADISADETWTSGNVYTLSGRIFVNSGTTLTIEPGVIIKGEAGSGTNAAALIVSRGAKIMAEGTAQNPIIFTSVADDIEPGMIKSPNLNPEINGLWGGLVVLGNAPISVSSNAADFQIEGIPPSDTRGLYGGNDPEDNSGSIRYVSIRHGGANIGEGNEINGLTLGGIGSKTVVDHVEVVANQDDGIEWFGGTVNVKNALIWNAGDDALDTDQAWNGSLDNFVVIAGPETDHALEADGPEGSLLGAHTLKNGSVKGSAVAELSDFRDGIRGSFQNMYFFGFPDPSVNGFGDLSISGDESLSNLSSGALEFSNLEVTLPEGANLQAVFKGGSHSSVTAVPQGANTVGANIAEFTGWTWADLADGLAEF